MRDNSSLKFDRRKLLKSAAFGSALVGFPGLLTAEEFIETAALTEGPFYPDKLPLDTDNDLLIINEKLSAAVGEITHLTGRVLSKSGQPIRNALVEIWQCDSNGAYLHSGTNNADKRDSNFQGYGRFLTDSKGQYYFRTIKTRSIPRPDSTYPFCHQPKWTSCLDYSNAIKDHPQNARDGVLRSLKNEQAIASVMSNFEPFPDSKIGELQAQFNLVLGKTAFEDESGKLRAQDS